MGDYVEKELKDLITCLIERVRVGVKEELTKISPFFEHQDRGNLRTLYEQGIHTVADLINNKKLVQKQFGT